MNSNGLSYRYIGHIYPHHRMTPWGGGKVGAWLVVSYPSPFVMYISPAVLQCLLATFSDQVKYKVWTFGKVVPLSLCVCLLLFADTCKVQEGRTNTSHVQMYSEILAHFTLEEWRVERYKGYINLKLYYILWGGKCPTLFLVLLLHFLNENVIIVSSLLYLLF